MEKNIAVAIRGMEFALPKTVFTNNDMAKIVETNDGSISNNLFPMWVAKSSVVKNAGIN